MSIVTIVSFNSAKTATSQLLSSLPYTTDTHTSTGRSFRHLNVLSVNVTYFSVWFLRGMYGQFVMFSSISSFTGPVSIPISMVGTSGDPLCITARLNRSRLIGEIRW